MAVFAKAWVKGMPITNVVLCFKSVGVYPLDRRVALTQITQESEISQQNTPTPFVPFCTPQKGVANATPLGTPLTDATIQPATFTTAEVDRFQARLRESEDSRYALRLQTFYLKQNATQGQGTSQNGGKSGLGTRLVMCMKHGQSLIPSHHRSSPAVCN